MAFLFLSVEFQFQDDGCGYFVWHDEPLRFRARTVIKELKMEN